MSTIFASRFSVRFVKSASVVAIAAALAGCAADTVRFSDGFYTGAVPQQKVGAVQTPFPENAPVQPYQPPSAHTQAPPTGLDYTYTSSVPQDSAVQRQQLATPTAAPANANLETIKSRTSTPPVIKSAATKAKAGWSAVGGTMVTARSNDTVETIAKRYGVPAGEVAKANSLNRSAVIASGTKLIIPVYNSEGAAPSRSTASNTAVTNKVATNTATTNVPVPNNRPRGTEVASLAPSIAASQVPAVANSVTKSGKYVVSSGDTLSRIAAQTGASVASIKRLNGLSSDNLQIGQSLLIPGFAGNPDAATLAAKPANVDPITTGNAKTVKKEVVAYTPPKAQVKTNGSIATIDETSKASAPANTGVATMRWPVKGR
ncbi:MAG: LysM peptidoglycan-binding domain-containing protein, partial [Pseudomonadota bacterium]